MVDCLVSNSIILSLSETIKLVGKLYVLLFNSSIKISCKKLQAMLKYQQRSQGRGGAFYVHPVVHNYSV